jgi:VIT1/CCC1 family predicted Fe2+/Mn2+ transporter
MYVGACVTMLACFALIYIITTSEDTSREWMIWVFMGITLALVIGGFGYETRYKRRHGYNPYSKYEKLFE